MIKDFILDTNVILHDCLSIQNFQENHVLIPITVLEELDRFKSQMNELGRNARQFSKIVDQLREKGSLVTGVPINSQGGMLRVVLISERALGMVPRGVDSTIADNRILAAALQNIELKRPTVLITKDTNMRIKADTLGIPAENYENGRVEFESLYPGIRNYGSHEEIVRSDLSPNEFIRVVDGRSIVLYRYDVDLNEIMPLTEDLESWGLSPKNEEQTCAMDLLLNDQIKLVTLVGKAGTGKTLTALACGLRKVTDEFIYRKMLVSRPVYPMGKDIGFLPGDVDEKLAPYMQPIYDNVEFLMSGGVSAPTKGTKKKSRKSKDEEEKEQAGLGKGHLELQAAGIMEVEPLLYIRGRSIPDVYMIVDEAQNLTPHEVKTIVTRAGDRTKIIFTGDPNQIDNPYVDASSNGLTYLVEKFKTEKIAGHITLTQGERSELAEIASNIL